MADIDYSELKERVGKFLYGVRSGWSSDQVYDINNCIDDGLRRVYLAHDWSFFRPVKTITTVDGTATYDMPTGCESVESKMHYAIGESDYYPPIEQRSESEIRRRRQDTEATDTDRPRFFSVTTGAYDGSTGSTRSITFWPTPDDEYVLSAVYRFRPTMLDNSAPYPVGNEIMAQVITEACLAAAERGFDERGKQHEDLYQQMLPRAIQADLEATAPMQLGPDAPAGEMTDYQAKAVLVGTISINGVPK